MKICCRCNKIKELSEFNKSSYTSDNLKSYCRECQRKEYYDNREKNLETKRWYYRNNKQIFAEKGKLYYEQNKEMIKKRANNYYYENKHDPNYCMNKFRLKYYELKNKRRRQAFQLKEHQKIQEMFNNCVFTSLKKICNKCNIKKLIWDFNRQKAGILKRRAFCKECEKLDAIEYRDKNREKLRNMYKNYNGRFQRRIANRIRGRIRCAVNQFKFNKKESSIWYLGYSIPDFVLYLESKFTKDMNWDKFLRGEIQLDHFLPLCSTDLSKEENLKKYCHYTNIQPLFLRDHQIKTKEDRKLSIHN